MFSFSTCIYFYIGYVVAICCTSNRFAFGHLVTNVACAKHLLYYYCQDVTSAFQHFQEKDCAN